MNNAILETLTGLASTVRFSITKNKIKNQIIKSLEMLTDLADSVRFHRVINY